MKRLYDLAGWARGSRFLRSLGLLAGANVIAQGLNFLVMPLLTRIYSAEAIGLQGLFLSLMTPLVLIASLGLQGAIALPRNDEEARGLVRLSVMLALGAGVATWLLLMAAGAQIFAAMGAIGLAPHITLLAACVALGGCLAALAQYFLRNGAFAEQARIVVGGSVLLNGGRLGLGAISSAAANLLYANAAAMAAALVAYLLIGRRMFTGLLTGGCDWRGLLHRYRDFPVLRMPQALINALTQGLPIWFLARQFGVAEAGQYALAYSVLSAPVNLLGKAVYDTFLPRIAEIHNLGQATRPAILKATMGCAVAGLVPLAVITLAGPPLFALLFGAEWVLAGNYGQWLALWCFLQLTNRPAVAAVSVLQIQGGLLIYEVLSTVAKIAALWAGFLIFADDVAAVALFCLVGSVAYVGLIVWAISRAQGVKA